MSLQKTLWGDLKTLQAYPAPP